MNTLILTPNNEVVCGMYQLAKDLAEELDADISTREDIYELMHQYDRMMDIYDRVITFLYPMHSIGRKLRQRGLRWVCYDQGIPPVTKEYFPDFFRRWSMKYVSWQNRRTMEGADEYWDVTERPQKPRWTKKSTRRINERYALYLGRRTDYKNYEWLKKTCEQLKIPLVAPFEWSDEQVHDYLSNARMLVTASTWEGYGRPVMEAEALGVPAVCFNVGAHKRHVKKGICVSNKDFDGLKKAIKEVWKQEDD